MKKLTPELFEKYFVGIRDDGAFEFKEGLLKHFPSRKQQATEWAQSIITQAIEALEAKEKAKKNKKKK